MTNSSSAARVQELVERLARLLQAEQRSALDEPGGALQRVHRQILGYLLRCNRYSDGPAALAEFLGLTKGTISQSVQLLERRGLLERQRHPGDGRRVRLRLTPEGRRLAEALTAPPILGEALAELGAEGDRLADRLEALLTALQRRHGGRAFGVCRTCRHFRHRPEGGFACGLTGEALSTDDAQRICREHEPAERR